MRLYSGCFTISASSNTGFQNSMRSLRQPIIILASLFLCSFGFAQNKVVITSEGDVIQLKKGESSREVAGQLGMLKQGPDLIPPCGTNLSFGYDPNHFPCNIPFVGYHHDVWGQWFLSPASGTIETLFVAMNDQNEMESGIAKIRIFRSNIYPGRGPGYPPYNSPRHSWGYYKDTNLVDEPNGSGITPFKGSATDTNWIPTNIPSDSLTPTGAPDTVPSFDPLGPKLWPLSGPDGFSHLFTINSTNAIVLGDTLVEPAVGKNDPIFVTIEQQGTHVTITSNIANWCESSQDIPVPPVNWKFYEHSAAGNRGWHARADANWMWWMVMRVTGDLPPEIISFDKLSHTISTGPRLVTATVRDCNPGRPDSAGVASVTLSYSINGGSEATVPMTNSQGFAYEAAIPGSGPDTYVKYHITATDIKGNATEAPNIFYRVVNIRTAYYAADTSAPFNWEELSGNGGTMISSSAFFCLRCPTAPTDDGTAGPVDMQNPFWLFGDTARYAWIGVNGALSITRQASDTQLIDGGTGSFHSKWIIPGSAVIPPITDMPRNFIAPLYNSFCLSPAYAYIPYAHGAIWYKKSGSRFIVEWDSVGVVSNLIPDTLYSFEVILDNADRSITFQYRNIHGPLGLDTSALIGIQSDTVARWLLLNQQNNPPELRPRNGKAIQFVVTTPVAYIDGWNMVSVPGNSPRYDRSFLFPSGISRAFAYEGSYVPADPLSRGPGYWIRLPVGGIIGIPSSTNTSVVVPVQRGWNMIGSTTASVPTNAVVAGGGASATSPYFGYGLTGYFASPTIDPGRAYWVKSSASGTLTISASSSVPKIQSAADHLANLNSLMIRDESRCQQTLYFGDVARLAGPVTQFEMPPPPPVGSLNVRFASQRMVEVHPSTLEDEVSYPIEIYSVQFPITVSWNLKPGRNCAYTLIYQNGTSDVRKILFTHGEIRIQRPVAGLILRVSREGGKVPSSFELDQNYPNPFNPTTEIHYSVPVQAHVTLRIFSLTGQEIAKLVDGEQEAGYYVITWNSRNQADLPIGSGVYFYRLVATEIDHPGAMIDRVRKMILLK